MATPSTFSLFLLLFITVATATNTTTSGSTNFIKTQCSTTEYPDLCVQSLSVYSTKIKHSPRQLAKTALTVSLAKTRYAKAYVARLQKTTGLSPRETGALKDCMEEICDTVDRLGKSVHEFQQALRAPSQERRWRISNVETWASAALTDENTCIDGFSDGGVGSRMKTKIQAQFTSVMQCTSNALVLVNHFANQYY